MATLFTVQRPLIVYLAGEIHTDWRAEVAVAVVRQGVDARLVSPVTDHSASDACGQTILGEREAGFWADQASAGINAIRTRTLIVQADVVVARFSLAYREFFEWNCAFDAGRAVALGKPLITVHPVELDHPLKEVDRGALAVVRHPDQVADILAYAFGDLSGREAIAATSAHAA